MAFQQGVFPIPKGVYFTQSKQLGDEYAERLENLEYGYDGLRLRGGIRRVGAVSDLLVDGWQVHYVAEYVEPGGLIVCLLRNATTVPVGGRVVVYDVLADEVVSDLADEHAVHTPVSHLEVTTGADNSPMLLFYRTIEPRKIVVGSWVTESAGIIIPGSPPEPYLYFTGGVVYKSRLYLYREGSNAVMYLPPGAVSGEVVPLKVDNIFGAAGSIVRVVVVGFSAGAGVQSWLAVLFDSGDILTMSGIDPDSATDWAVETKVSLGTRVYPTAVAYGTSAYIMTDAGILDLATVIANNGVLTAATVGIEVESYLRRERAELTFVRSGERIMLVHRARDEHLVFSTRHLSWTLYKGFRIATAGALGEELYFAERGGGALLRGFAGLYDELGRVDADGDEDSIGGASGTGTPIIGVLHSKWFDFGTNNNKKFVYMYVNAGYRGNYIVSINYDTNYTRGLGVSQLRLHNYAQRWSGFSGCAIGANTWATVKELLWSGVSDVEFPAIKLNRMAIARAVSIRLVVRAEAHEELIISGISCDYIEQGR